MYDAPCEIGILGGGQLALMTIEAALRLNERIRIAVWADKDDSPALNHAYIAVRGSFSDFCMQENFARIARTVVIETENIPSETLIGLARLGQRASPTPSFLSIAQNRLREKELANKLGIPVPKFCEISDLSCTIRAGRLEKYQPYVEKNGAVLKTVRGGYDGKLQRRISTVEELPAAFAALGGVQCELQEWLRLKQEVSVIALRDCNGMAMLYPPIENVHEDGILIRSIYSTGGHISARVEQQVREYTLRFLNQLKTWGILAVEYFVTDDDTVLFNELAPRPHNSGHLTIEGFATSQFEQLVRIAAGLPLGSVEPRCRSAKMKNLIGEEILRAETYRQCGFTVHEYGKELRSGRKMGHATRVQI